MANILLDTRTVDRYKQRIAELEAELTECREERDKLRGALEIIVSNATMIDDPTMEGITDCFRVPLEDIEIHAHGALSV